MRGHWILAAALALSPVGAGAAEDAAGEHGLAKAPLLPEGWVAIEERHWEVLRDEPILRFHAANRRLEAEEPLLAALELRKGAAYLRVEAARSEGQSRQALGASVLEVEGLAADLEASRPADPEAVQAALARSHHALAVAHAERALAAFEAGREAEANAELETAAEHVESANRSAGGVLGKGAGLVVGQIRNLVGGVVRADGWAIKQVGNGIRALGKGLETVGKKVQPGPDED